MSPLSPYFSGMSGEGWEELPKSPAFTPTSQTRARWGTQDCRDSNIERTIKMNR